MPLWGKFYNFLPIVFILFLKSRPLPRPAFFCCCKLTQGRNNLKINRQSFVENQGKPLGTLIKRNFSEELINGLAAKTGFIKRSRKLSAYHFVNSLMFSCCNQANTSLPDIAADIDQQFSVRISKEALHKKFSAQGANFLKELIKAHLSKQFSLQRDSELQKHFSAINIKDSSKFSLPSIYNGDYPGFGNFHHGQGMMNIQYEYDLASGNWKTLELTTISRNDQQDSKQTIESICAGELYIRDLGYVTPTYLKAVIDKDACFLNRLPAQATIHTLEKKQVNWDSIERKLKQIGSTALDMDVLIYQKDPIACRLVIERVTDAVYRERIRQAERSAKRHGVGLSHQHRVRCRYNTFITNVERQILPIEKIRKVYYLRWQIELAFKTWKSFFEIGKLKKVKKERLECQLLAKLLWILLNWRLFQSCNHHVQHETPEKGVSVLKFFKRCLSFSSTLRLVVLNRLPIQIWLNQIFLPLIENTACEAAAGKTTHYQVISSLLLLS
jgi:hypothetical protein